MPSQALLTKILEQVLDRAYESGVRYFDAARSYGLSEDFLSSWLQARGIEPGQVVIGRWCAGHQLHRGISYTALPFAPRE